MPKVCYTSLHREPRGRRSTESTTLYANAVNLGSVSNPFPPDLRASYALLDTDSSGYRLQHRRADYDRAAVIAQTQALGHPGAEYIIAFFRGQHRPRWQRQLQQNA